MTRNRSLAHLIGTKQKWAEEQISNKQPTFTDTSGRHDEADAPKPLTTGYQNIVGSDDKPKGGPHSQDAAMREFNEWRENAL